MDHVLKLLQDIRPDSNFSGSTDFLADNLLDSLDIMNVVARLEDAFDITIKSEDIEPKSFVSVEALRCMVKKSGGFI